MTLPLTIAMLLDSALRAALLGGCVWFLLRLTRVRDVQAEIMIWTAVLIVSFAMPLLCREVPGFFSVALPALPNAAPPAFDGAMVARPATPVPSLLWALYGGVAAISLARLLIGLLLTLRLYRKAHPIAAPWAAGRTIRASKDISGPISFGTGILLPADCCEWPEAKRLAVLAHEQSHIRRGDFFIQLFAALHRALFWFSPFAWWLQKRLCELAEVASDEAAVQVLNDRASYAEILVEVSRHAHSAPAQIAMAKGPNILWRVDRILGEAPDSRLSATARVLGLGAILPAACLVAAAHAVTASPHSFTMAAASAPVIAAKPTSRAFVAAPPPRHSRLAKPIAVHPQADPRALLDDDGAVMVRAVLPTAGKTGKKKSGDAVVILNANGLAGD